MDNRDSFEEILRGKIEGLEKQPSQKLGRQLKDKLKQEERGNSFFKKILFWAISIGLLAFLSFQYFQYKDSVTSPKSIKQIQQANHLDFRKNGHHNHSIDTNKKDKILVTQTPDDIKNKPYIQARLQAKAEQKMIFLHAFNLDCHHCQKMKDSTLTNQEVQAVLQEHFVKIDIDLQLLENIEVAQFYDIKTSPKFLFLNGKGQLVTMINGFQEPTEFMATLEKAMEEEAAGSYIDLISRKRVNPTPDKLHKVDSIKHNSLLEGVQLIAAKVFPNPTMGKFTATIKGQKSPLQIKMIDLNGKIIFEERQMEFNGEIEQHFDLTGQKGHYIIQFSQGKSMIYKKVIIQ